MKTSSRLTSPASKALSPTAGDVSQIASVASFFVSRIDSDIDGCSQAQLDQTADPAKRKVLGGLRGKVAIANAKLAYSRYKRLYSQ